MSSSNNFKFSFRIFGSKGEKIVGVKACFIMCIACVILIGYKHVAQSEGDKIFYRMFMVTPPRRPLVRLHCNVLYRHTLWGYHAYYFMPCTNKPDLKNSVSFELWLSHGPKLNLVMPFSMKIQVLPYATLTEEIKQGMGRNERIILKMVLKKQDVWRREPDSPAEDKIQWWLLWNWQ